MEKNSYKWNDEFYVLAFRMAQGGHTDEQIANACGVEKQAFLKWRRTRPALQKAIDDGRAARRPKGITEFMRHVADRLPEKLQPLWDELCSEDPTVRDRALTSVNQKDRRERQRLFVYAYVAMNFNMAAAARAIGISQFKPKVWMKKDPYFRKMLEFIKDARGDFFETALMDLIAARDTSAVLFANRTFNRERGYDHKKTIRIEGGVEHKHSITAKELSPETKRQMLEELRRKKEARLEHKNDKIQDAEFTEVRRKK